MDERETARAGTGRGEVVATGGGGAAATRDARRHRHDGWTPRRRHEFLAALARTASVTEACHAVGMSTTSAYRARRAMPAFARGWDEALEVPRPALEEAAYQRAVLGWDEPVFQGGRLVGHRRRYSDGLLRLLLGREAIARTMYPPPRPQVSEKEINDALLERLDALAKRWPPEAEPLRPEPIHPGPIHPGPILPEPMGFEPTGPGPARAEPAPIEWEEWGDEVWGPPRDCWVPRVRS